MSTKKYLTKKLLIETKWIHKPYSDEVQTTDFNFIMPYHVVTYCRVCNQQHSHNKVADTKNGAWYYCIGCAEVVG